MPDDVEPLFQVVARYVVEETVTVTAKDHDDASKAYKAYVNQEPDPRYEELKSWDEDRAEWFNGRLLMVRSRHTQTTNLKVSKWVPERDQEKEN